eukprot:Nk52_evm44s1360 gene=Nk52_evmTU44s1360
MSSNREEVHMEDRPSNRPPPRPKDEDVARLAETKRKQLEGKATANYFRIKPKFDRVKVYSIRFEPDEIGKQSLRNTAVSYLNREGKIPFQFLYSDGFCIYAADNSAPSQTVEVDFEFFESNPKQFKMILEFKEAISPSHPKIVRNISSFVRRTVFPKVGYQQVGNKFYQPQLKEVLPNLRLEFWPGIDMRIEAHDNDNILMNLDTTFKTVRQENCLDVLYDKYAKNPDQYRRLYEAEMKDKNVLTKYNNQSYKIIDVVWTESPKSSFEIKKRDGTSIWVTYKKYLLKKYGIDVLDDEQPLLQAQKKGDRKSVKGADEIVMLVPKTVILTGLSEDIKSDFRVMRNVKEILVLDGRQRQDLMRKLVSNMVSLPELRKEWNRLRVDIELEPFRMDCKVNKVQELVFGNQRGGGTMGLPLNAEKLDWTGDIKNFACLDPMEIRDSEFLVLHSHRTRDEADMFMNDFMQVAPNLGMRVGQPIMQEMRADSARDIEECLSSNWHNGIKLVVCILSRNDPRTYEAVKKFCSVKEGIVSQCLTAPKMNDQKKRKNIVTKIAVQINAKLGGACWRLQKNPYSGMVVGISTHADPFRRGRVVAIVSSLDKAMTQYHSSTSFQESRGEFTVGIKDSICKAVESWAKESADKEMPYPKNIIIYRDGESDADLSLILDSEIPCLKDALRNINPEFPDYDPRICYIIVRSKTSTRIFSETRDRVMPGTCVMSGVTKKSCADFYLVPQSARQGVANPVYYNVIHHHPGTLKGIQNLEIDQIQQLTFKLNHLYANWTGTVSVPAPVQYAKKLAQQTGDSLEADAHPNLCERLHFL